MKCQVCGSDTASRLDYPGPRMVELCVEHVQSWQTLLLHDRIELMTAWQSAFMTWRQVGMPSMTGLNIDLDTTARTLMEAEAAILALWNDWLERERKPADAK